MGEMLGRSLGRVFGGNGGGSGGPTPRSNTPVKHPGQTAHRDTTFPVVTAPSRRMPGPPGTRYASSRPLSG
jgi:hypothetical protein